MRPNSASTRSVSPDVRHAANDWLRSTVLDSIPSRSALRNALSTFSPTSATDAFR